MYAVEVKGQLVLSDNLNNLEVSVREALQQYDIVVSEDSVKHAKGLRAEINKGKKALTDAWKQHEDELLAPLNERKAKLREILTLCDEAMFKLDEQVRKFENEKRVEVQAKCQEYLAQLCDKANFDPALVEISHLTNLTYLSASGALSKAGKDAVESAFNLARVKYLESAMSQPEPGDTIFEITCQFKIKAANLKQVQVAFETEIKNSKLLASTLVGDIKVIGGVK